MLWDRGVIIVRLVIGLAAVVVGAWALVTGSWWTATAMGLVLTGQLFTEWDSRRRDRRRTTDDLR